MSFVQHSFVGAGLNLSVDVACPDPTAAFIIM